MTIKSGNVEFIEKDWICIEQIDTNWWTAESLDYENTYVSTGTREDAIAQCQAKVAKVKTRKYRIANATLGRLDVVVFRFHLWIQRILET